jgi:hypothetical protein
MRRYAAVAGLPRRLVAPVPALTPWLSAQWVNLVTPVPRSIAVPLVESLIHEMVCRDHDVAAYIPDPEGGLTPCDRALELALARVRRAGAPAGWPVAGTARAPSGPPSSGPPPSAPSPTDPAWSGGTVYEDVRERRTCADAQALWEVIESVGGEGGWYAFPPAWSVRGWVDQFVGDLGLRRSQRDPRRLEPGEALDWWRVEHLDRPRLLRLRAEMRLPGQAWLELSAAPGPGGSVYRQRAVFLPRGLTGQLYWKSLAPFRDLVFGGMARTVASAAEHTPIREQTPG